MNTLIYVDFWLYNVYNIDTGIQLLIRISSTVQDVLGQYIGYAI